MLALFALAALQLSPRNTHADPALWNALRAGGYVIMIRHAQTEPGTGDPPGFKLGDCSSQRNLSDVGREQARRVGAAFLRERVPATHVLSSEWCRCQDTARIAFGRVETWAALNSVFAGNAAEEPARTRSVRERAGSLRPGENLVLVTHQVNISAVTGMYPASGEMILLRLGPGGVLEVAGKLAAP